MGKIEVPKKIRAEDFTGDEQQLISKISSPFNDLADSFYFALNKSIDFDNLNQDIITVNVNTGTSGQVINLPQVRFNLRVGSPRGSICINAFNSTNPNNYTTGTPFISYTVSSPNTIQILNVTNLPANSQFVLTLVLIG